MADSMTKHMEHVFEFTEELKKAIVAYRAVPVPAIFSSEEAAARRRLDTALCRVHIALITAPASTAVISPTFH